jgi:hypothetical protein
MNLLAVVELREDIAADPAGAQLVPNNGPHLIAPCGLNVGCFSLSVPSPMARPTLRRAMPELHLIALADSPHTDNVDLWSLAEAPAAVHEGRPAVGAVGLNAGSILLDTK